MTDVFPYGYSFPYGYAGSMLTLAELQQKATVSKLNPEFWRRFRALMEHAATQGVALGVGTGWRIQPNPPPPGFASPGNSNHEGFPADGVSGGAVAIDTVTEGAWVWMEPRLKDYGLRSFNIPSTSGYNGNNEPWHIQPIEIPASRSWRKEPWILEKFPLPIEEDMPLTPTEIQKIADAVWEHRMGKRVYGIVRRYLGAHRPKAQMPPETMLARIDKNTKPQT